MKTTISAWWPRMAFLLGAVFGMAMAARADVRLPALFSEHMVLQQGVAAPVWGWAQPGETVTVAVAGQAQTAVADAQGKWMVKFAPLKPGGPHRLTVTGKNSLSVGDVLIGEVWLGSGQSNMAFQVQRAAHYEQEQSAADLPQIRMFTVTSAAATQAQADCSGAWTVCAPETVGRFSATLFFAGRELHKALGVPVGLINSSVGGTPIELWISDEAQRHAPELEPFFVAVQTEQKRAESPAAKAQAERQLAAWKAAAAKAKADGQSLPRKPRDVQTPRGRKGTVGGLFNGKIAPLVPYALGGVLWYQGEANTKPGRAEFYKHQLPLLVQDWRARWGAELPFAWVQLPNLDRKGDGWMVIREAMLQSLKVPNTGMAVTIDIGDPVNIHPKNKQEVGRRLALWALGTVYGRKVATFGPLPAAHAIKGDTVTCSFTHTDNGLVAKGGDLKGFTIAAADKKWVVAIARIVGNTVVVSHPEVHAPVAVRYAWGGNPDCNLYNGAGLPASPFRTDAWDN